ncbi:unnamed protein product [Chironomus riparius]|uniref:Uncharacterized protein n=1 Tax=Chironomus riparius TaxID=315576 RepID=A0A9N9RQJ4_9DIPT|nr:unnamed protein product [Chironomus riparius]
MILNSVKKIVITVLDHGFLYFIITPLIVILWFSCWSIMDYLLTDCHNTSVLVAFGGQFLLLFFYDETKMLLNMDNKIISTLVPPIYGIICGIVMICFWRFSWIFFDEIVMNDDTSLVLNIVQNSLILMGFKVFVNTISVPFIARFNPNEPMPQSITYFGKSKVDGIFTFVHDCICTILITGLIVFIWRDLWMIANLKIYPYNDYYSTIASLLIGYTVAIICFLIHPTINFLCEMFIDFKVLYRNIHAGFCLVATINIWRGYWMLFTFLANGSIYITSTLCLSSLALLIIMGNSDCLAFAALLTDGNRIRFQHHYISSLLSPITITASNSTPENTKEPNV